jgi:DNA mismatch repair protein MSH5
MQVGFLISLDKREHSHNVTTNDFPELPEDFTFLFIQDNNAFFKNPEMQQLDEEIGDLDAYIKDTESMIVSELEEDILDCESELRSTFGALAQIDCILSFAHSASDLNYTRPEVVSGVNPGEEGTILIENGRHPLQELITDDDFIPNDTKIDANGRVNIVTGPNFSGKSCYIRQVGMLVYMAHIGSYIPCDAGRISITDQILARISSVETCSVPQSTFQQDLTQMATILRRSTEKSLVLIDEFGKGLFLPLLFLLFCVYAIYPSL